MAGKLVRTGSIATGSVQMSRATHARRLRQKTHQIIKRVGDSFDTLQFNTPVAALMELSNAISDIGVEPEIANGDEMFAVREALTALTLMLTPFAPHTAEELFSVLIGNDNGILANGARFPEYNEELAKADEIEIPVQVNGKLPFTSAGIARNTKRRARGNGKSRRKDPGAHYRQTDRKSRRRAKAASSISSSARSVSSRKYRGSESTCRKENGRTLTQGRCHFVSVVPAMFSLCLTRVFHMTYVSANFRNTAWPTAVGNQLTFA